MSKRGGSSNKLTFSHQQGKTCNHSGQPFSQSIVKIFEVILEQQHHQYSPGGRELSYKSDGGTRRTF